MPNAGQSSILAMYGKGKAFIVVVEDRIPAEASLEGT